MYELNLKSWVIMILTALFILSGGIGGCMAFMPKYRVWQQEMVGKAEARAADLRKTTGEYLDSTLQKSMEAMSGSLAEMKKIHQQIRAVSGKM